MDIRHLFNDALIRRGCEPISTPVFDVNRLNDFLQEAYRINRHITELRRYLRSIRPCYLTLQSHRPFPSRKINSRDARSDPQALTDNDRVRIDHDTATLLSQLNSAIKELAAAAERDSLASAVLDAKKRNKLGLGALGRWAAGGGMMQPELSPEEKAEEGRREQLRVFREAVIWFLSRRLEVAGNNQRNMVETRLEREREKAKSSLDRAGRPGNIASYLPPPIEIEKGDSTINGSLQNKVAVDEKSISGGIEGWDSLPPEQLQIFEREQQDMLRQFNDELNKIKAAESSLLEISQLQSQIAMNLEVQETHIDQLVQDSFRTAENVGSGNKELKKASERPSTARMVFWATCALCSTLVLWDLLI